MECQDRRFEMQRQATIFDCEISLKDIPYGLEPGYHCYSHVFHANGD